MIITLADIREYQEKRKGIKTIGQFKELGRELRDKFALTDRQAINILNGNDKEILRILEAKQGEK